MKWKFLVLLAFYLTKINGDEAPCTANENALNGTSSNASEICATPRDGVGDDRTFPSRCALATYNCRNKNKPFIYRHEGPCNVDPTNPCKHVCLRKDKMVCGGPVTDHQGPNMTFASVCELQNYNCDHQDSKYRLVFNGRCEDADCPRLCGSEENVLCAGPKRGSGQMKSFQNPCHLENYNCENRSNEYKFIYFGSCNRRPEGACRSCTNERNLICAKSYHNISRTFYNRCELEKFNCEHHTNFLYQHDQRCSQPCESCHQNNDPVCAFSIKSGTPLRTFKNICLLRQHNCQEDLSGSGDFYEYLKNGDCQGPDSSNRICRQQCSLTSRPICASSSGNPDKRKTFRNLCELEKHNCEFYNDVYYYTSDGVCEVRRPDPISPCEIQSCSSVLEPEICANPRNRVGPGETFSGNCELQRHNCRYHDNQYIFSHIGPCRKSENLIHCKKVCGHQQSPICGTSDEFNSKMTFANVCEMENYNCDYGTFGSFRMLHAGECQTANIPWLWLTNCKYNCSSTYEPVCASSLWGLRKHKTFYNRCHFDRYNCENFLFKYEGLHAGECVSDNSRPPIFENKCGRYNCAKEYSPICAKSAILTGISKTFTSICAMDLHNCQQETDRYEFNHYGICKLIEPNPPAQIVSCIRDCDCDYRPVCAKPRIGAGPRQTFSNRCKLDNYNCENFADIHEGACGITSTPPVAPPPAASCKRNCGCEVNPVCASPEGRTGIPITFQNRCKLDNYNCERISNRYRFEYFGECTKFEKLLVDSSMPDFQLTGFSDCYRECPEENRPICAEVIESIGFLDLKRAFKNRCELDNHNCLFKFHRYRYLHEGECSSTYTVKL